ncbi:hypothetical protein HPG69_009442 [Diceros bicornis minor]|uniref:40S ribosomal protein SA n=1 Tax=Diceros bicornis minor TaxID=77932 RepID=A0A7J7F2X6_DICBM|nr:hypothetical protein HPG69_009442 [Diceros bicornis minor]
MKEEDVLKFPAAGIHLRGTNLDFLMEQYTYKRESDGIYIINLKSTWEKLLLAAHANVAIENLADVSVIASRNIGQQAVLKLPAATEATPVAGQFSPGTSSKQIQAVFREPRLLVVTDPGADYRTLTEAFMLTCLPLLCVTRLSSALYGHCHSEAHSAVLRVRSTISHKHPQDVRPDPYFYRDPDEIAKEEQATAEKAVTKEEFQGGWTASVPEFIATQPEVT